MKLPRHPWLIGLYRAYAWIHGFPDPYPRAAKMFAGMREELWRQRSEAWAKENAEAMQRVGPLMGIGNSADYCANAYQQADLQNAYMQRQVGGLAQYQRPQSNFDTLVNIGIGIMR